jgi:hypothetical protein
MSPVRHSECTLTRTSSPSSMSPCNQWLTVAEKYIYEITADHLLNVQSQLPGPCQKKKSQHPGRPTGDRNKPHYLHNSNVLSSIELGLVAVSLEEAPFRRQARHCNQLHQFLPLSSIPESNQMFCWNLQKEYLQPGIYFSRIRKLELC